MRELSKYWWSLLLRGIIAILVAILAFARPGLTIELLVIFLGIWFVVEGIIALIAAIRAAEHHKTWWVFLLEGVVGLFVGVLIFAWPDITAVALIYFIAAWAIITGIFELVGAFSSDWGPNGQWLLATAGILSLILGLAILIWTAFSITVLIWLVALYALVYGISMIMFAIQVRSLGSSK